MKWQKMRTTLKITIIFYFYKKNHILQKNKKKLTQIQNIYYKKKTYWKQDKMKNLV